MSELKIVSGQPIPWLDKTQWYFPHADKNRLMGEVTRGSDDLIDAMGLIKKYGTSFRECVQAGGAVGVWPIGLSSMFDRVYTFEADHDNYQCLARNLQGVDGFIDRRYAALWHESGGMGEIRNDEPENAGAGYVVANGSHAGAMLITIDSLNLQECDLIYLDIEGAETNALVGASDTIQRCRPLIGIEDKKNNLWTRYGHKRGPVEMLIDKYNYVELERYHLDVLLGPGEVYDV